MYTLEDLAVLLDRPTLWVNGRRYQVRPYGELSLAQWARLSIVQRQPLSRERLQRELGIILVESLPTCLPLPVLFDGLLVWFPWVVWGDQTLLTAYTRAWTRFQRTMPPQTTNGDGAAFDVGVFLKRWCELLQLPPERVLQIPLRLLQAIAEANEEPVETIKNPSLEQFRDLVRGMG